MSASPRVPLRTFVVATVLALIAAVATYVLFSDDDSTDAAPQTGGLELDPVDDADPSEVTFTTFDDEVVELASLRGKPLLLNFFAENCPPCVKEMPALEAAHQAVGDHVQFLGLAVQDRPEGALGLVERTGVTYRVGQDRDGSVFTSVEGMLLPTTVIFSADGELVASHTGELTEAEILDMIDSSLGVTP